MKPGITKHQLGIEDINIDLAATSGNYFEFFSPFAPFHSKHIPFTMWSLAIYNNSYVTELKIQIRTTGSTEINGLSNWGEP